MARAAKSPCLRLFISIKTMQPVSPDTKVCDSCRAAYYGWKKNNPDFGDILSRIEEEVSNDDGSFIDGSSVNEQSFLYKLSFLCFHFDLIE